MKRAALGIASLALIALAWFWFFKSTKVDQTGRERFERNLRQLKQIDALFTQQILEAKFNMVNDYDAFVGHQQALDRLVQELGNPPDFVQGERRRALEHGLDDYQALLRTREEKFEEFKSQNAVLKNALSYFPVAGEEAIGSLSLQGPEPELESALNEMMRRVMRYSLSPTEGAEAVEQSIDRVEKWRTEHPGHAAAPTVANLLLHARTVKRRTPAVTRLIHELVSLPRDESMDVISQAYEASLTEALKRAGIYRILLHILLTVFVLGIAGALVALRASNRNLEQKVSERTEALRQSNRELQNEITERQRIQNQFLEASRLAGMAEVATGVLHNVGNVLNSANVSAAVLGDSLRRSPSDSLSRVAAILNEQGNQLAAFFATDPRGPKLPGLLTQISERLQRSEQKQISELESLVKHIEHIKDIVAQQQSYARGACLTETLKVSDLVEDTLRMNADAFQRHAVEVIPEFATDVPLINTEKHKVLQILVNLVRNAKYACAQSNKSNRRLIVRTRHDNGRVRIQVIDNGVGIPVDNLGRIFNHGFTTKNDGHGFGLHSSANAAKELGGALTVSSDGPGLGATFTLELPVQRETPPREAVVVNDGDQGLEQPTAEAIT